MKKLPLTAAVLSLATFALVAGLAHLHVSPLSSAGTPPGADSGSGPRDVELAGSPALSSARPRVFVPPPNGTAPTAPEPPPTPVYDEVRELDLDEAYERLHGIAFDSRLARRHLRELDLIARDARLHDDLRRLAVWGLARGGDLESIRAQLADGNAAEVQLTALEMLRRHDGASSRDLIAGRARAARDPRVRESALRSLSHLEGPVDVEVFLDDDDIAVRSAALEILSGEHDDEAVRALLEHVPEEESETVALAAALSAHGHSPEAVLRIDELAREPSLSPEAARSIALSKLYARRPELTAVACSGSH